MSGDRRTLRTSTRLAAGGLGLAGLTVACLMVAMKEPSLILGIVSGFAVGPIFLHAAIRGRSPAWLENPGGFIVSMLRRRRTGGDASLAVPDELRERLALAIADLKPGPGDPIATVAREHGGLPLCADLGGVILLRPDGAVVEVPHHSVGASPQAVSRRWTTRALMVGLDRHPWLGALVPKRPPNAVDCSRCAGRGRSLATPLSVGAFCGRCDGLGWRDGDEGELIP